jgi:RNA polymerase subunit RPABC4/transcription elongation factor Spt4
MDNTCVCCGAVIPEGRQVCPNCERRAEDGK